MTLRIRIDHGQDAGKTWRLVQEGAYHIGRLPSATVQVLDMKVSKNHGRFVVQGQGEGAKTFLEDLDSRHGMLVNGQPVNGRKPLKPGDEIRLGLSILRVLSDGEADLEPQPTVPASGGEAAGTSNGTGGAAADPADRAAGTPPRRRRTFKPDALADAEIGGYKVLQKIGQGGMGSVYVAEQLSLNREVALKVLSPKFTSDSNFVDQFVNEARSAAALNHPNVVQVYDVGREDGRYYFSMEYVPGGSLEERLAEDGPADWREGLNWLIDASNALIFAQKREILHRDVKPDNLMLAEDGSAKLCDLGLAKKASNEDMLAAGIIGTPAFISPEAIRRRKDIDVRSDLYSLGCTFYRILTGENPFPAKTVKEILVGHLKSPVPRVSDKVDGVPPQLDDVIHQLMQKEPSDRFEAPEDLLQSLDKIRVQHGLEAHGLRPASRKPLVIALIAVVLLGGGALAFLLTRPTPPPVAEDPDRVRREQEAIEQAQRLAEDNFVADADRNLANLKVEMAEDDLEEQDNWSKPTWPDLAGRFEALAVDIQAHEAFGKRDELASIASEAKERASEIRGYVKLRQELDKDVKNARIEWLGKLDAALEKRRGAIDGALEAKSWVKAAALANPEELAELVRAFVEKTVESILPAAVPAATRELFEGSALLDNEKQIQPRVAKAFPGAPPGKALVDRAVGGALLADAEVHERVAELVAQKTPAAFEQAGELLETYVDSLPERVDPNAGPLVDSVARFRDKAVARQGELLRQAQTALRAVLDHDRKALHALLRTLRKPGGLLFGFQFEEARKAADAAVQAMKTDGYRGLAQQILEDVQALDHLMGRLASTFASGWEKDRVTWKDDRGRDESEKVKALTKLSMQLGADEYRFEALGVDWVLRHLFFVDPEALTEPRFAFEGEDHRGLVVLAELAVHYDLVDKHLQSYVAWLPADRTATQTAIRRRMGARTQLEKDAAEAWKAASHALAEVARAVNAMDPALRGEEDFWNDAKGRAAFVARNPEFRRLLEQAFYALRTVRDVRFQKTYWATSLLEKAPMRVAFAGETITSPPPEAPQDPPKDPQAPGDGSPKDAPGEAPEAPPQDAPGGAPGDAPGD